MAWILLSRIGETHETDVAALFHQFFVPLRLEENQPLNPLFYRVQLDISAGPGS